MIEQCDSTVSGIETILLHVFDVNFDRIGIVETYISLTWVEDYQDKGSFNLVCVDSKNNVDLLKQGRYLCRKGKTTAMVIRYIKYDSKNHRINVKGFTTTDLIDKRIISGTLTVHNVENGMYQAVSSNIRGMPYFTVAQAIGLSVVFDTQYTLKSVIEVEKELAKQSEYGFRVVFDYRNKQHVFTVYQGVDRTYGNGVNDPVVFSQEYHNLFDLSIADDMSDFRNVAYVAGEGEGASRTIVIVNDSITGAARFEMPVDARDLQKAEMSEQEYLTVLEARGIAKLNEKNRKQVFSADVDPSRFGKDYSLGDKVTCKSTKYGVQINVRIAKATEISENNTVKVKLVLGEPEINPLKR